MLIADVYQILTDDTKVVQGDQWKLEHQNDDCWVPCCSFIGHRVDELAKNRVVVRRLICHEPQV